MSPTVKPSKTQGQPKASGVASVKPEAPRAGAAAEDVTLDAPVDVAALQAQLAKAEAKVRNQKDRIVYLEGCTNHATGTPLTHALNRIGSMQNAFRLAQEALQDPALTPFSGPTAQRKADALDAIQRLGANAITGNNVATPNEYKAYSEWQGRVLAAVERRVNMPGCEEPFLTLLKRATDPHAPSDITKTWFDPRDGFFFELGDTPLGVLDAEAIGLDGIGLRSMRAELADTEDKRAFRVMAGRDGEKLFMRSELVGIIQLSEEVAGRGTQVGRLLLDFPVLNVPVHALPRTPEGGIYTSGLFALADEIVAEHLWRNAGGDVLPPLAVDPPESLTFWMDLAPTLAGEPDRKKPFPCDAYLTEIDPRNFTVIQNTNGETMLCRVIAPGDRYGLEGCLKHGFEKDGKPGFGADKPGIQFRSVPDPAKMVFQTQARVPFGWQGGLGGLYYLETLMESVNDSRGLRISDQGDLSLSISELRKAVMFAATRMDTLSPQWRYPKA